MKILPAAALLALAGLPGAGEIGEGIPLAARVEAALDGGVRWLLANQEPSGAWGSHRSPRPIEVFCSPPGSHQTFRIGTTCLAVMALSDTGRAEAEVQGAIDRALDYLLVDYDVKRQSGLEHYNVWAYGFMLQCLGERLARVPGDPRAGKMREVCDLMVRRLERSQCLDGGWGYLSLDEVPTYQPSFTSMSFTTATLVVGMQRAMSAGVAVPGTMLERALDSIQRCKTPLGYFTYGEIWNDMPTQGINLAKGAACRTPACLYALDLFRDNVEEDEYAKSLENLLVKNRRMQILSLRRPIPHESWYQISGYFYLYGHAYAAYVLDGLSDGARRRLSPSLAEAVLVTQQPDGSFWDYPLYSYHKPYGTAYAILALSRVVL
ncbi:MAG: hypothetical protein AB1726_05120 [Planctomycetota bacterium]